MSIGRFQGERASTHDRLLEAAYEQLLEVGYEGATIESVARRASLTIGAIYRNFTNKPELLVLAVLRRPTALPHAVAAPEMADRVGQDEPEGRARLDELALFLAEHLSAAPHPDHRLLTEVAGATVQQADGVALLR